jgi:hypothetical protein
MSYHFTYLVKYFTAFDADEIEDKKRIPAVHKPVHV